MFLTLMMTVCWYQVPGMGPSEKEQKQKQINMLHEESMEAAKIYAQLMQKGLDAGLLTQLGEEFVKVSKPIQAKACFGEALKLKADHQAAKDGLAKSEKRLAFLNGRLETFQKKMTKDNNYQFGCRSASILFHMGETTQALELLGDLRQQFGRNGEIMSMEKTFSSGDELRYSLMRDLSNRFSGSVKTGSLDGALEELGKLMFLSLGDLPVTPYMERLQKAFPKQVNHANLKTALQFLVPEVA